MTDVDDRIRSTGVAPSGRAGAVAGVVTVLAFAVVHDLWIADIWFNIVPMVVAGAGCGAALAWSYRESAAGHTWGRWWGHIGLSAGILIGLGAWSLLTLEPRFSMAELMTAEDPLSMVLPPAMPLMAWGVVVGTAIVWVLASRRVGAIPAIFVTQVLLVLLVGHNLAILGLVDIPADEMFRLWSFLGVTCFLAAGFGVAAMAASRLVPTPGGGGGSAGRREIG